MVVSGIIFPCCRLRPSLPFVSWNQEGWKTSLCSVPPVGHSHSLLALANNTCVKPAFLELRERFTKLYRKKVLLNLGCSLFRCNNGEQHYRCIKVEKPKSNGLEPVYRVRFFSNERSEPSALQVIYILDFFLVRMRASLLF